MTDRRSLARKPFTTNTVEFGKMLELFPERVSVIAEGDSWFAYPRKGLINLGPPSNTIDQLARMHRFNLLQLSSSGDEILDMLSGSRKQKLLELVQRFNPDFLLFSGGGNDVVGKYTFEFFLTDGEGSSDWEAYLDAEAVDRRLDQVASCYRDLVDYCHDLSQRNAGVAGEAKPIRLVTHTYDYVVPDKRGAEFLGGLVGRVFLQRSLGPWMYPYLMRRKVPKSCHAPIARYLIDQLADRLLQVAADHPDPFLLADTRKAVPRKHWLNEIHPDSKGFEKVARRVFQVMKPWVRQFEAERA